MNLGLPQAEFGSSERSIEPSASTCEIPALVLAIGSGLTLVAVALLMRLAGLDLGGPTKLNLLATMALLPASLSPVLLSRRNESQRIAGALLESVGLLAFISAAGVIASYPVAYFSSDFSDAILQRIDHALGFDWLGWYEIVSAHPSLQVLGRLLYDSVFVSPSIILWQFARSGQRAKAHLFIGTYWLAVILTLAVFAFMPAQGPLAVLWHGPIPYMPDSGLYQAAIIPALKQHTMHHVMLGSLRGLVSTPSFHTTAAMLFIAAAWSIRRLRWPVLLINLLMLVAIPVEGTHYLIDMIAGVLVGLVALVAMSGLLRRTPAKPWSLIVPARNARCAS